MTGRIVLLAGALLATGCSAGTPSGDPTRSTGPSDDLAPSQLTEETAPPPETPPPCDPSSVGVWTAQVAVVDGLADAVLRVRNDGAVRCEVDVGGSPYVDPLMEPDVWLDPGAWADLLVGPDGSDGCRGAASVRSAQLDVNGDRVVVETAAVVPCGWMLTAFYPNESSDVPCVELDVVAADRAILVRNGGASACLLGEVVGVGGNADLSVAVDGDPAVPVLAAGDVVAIELERLGGGVSSFSIVFDSGVTIEVASEGDSVVVAAGPPRPWIGGPASPSGDGPEELIAALDPFGEGA